MSEMNDEAVPLLSHLLCYRQERKRERVEAGCLSALGRARGAKVPRSSHPDSRVTNPSSHGGTQATVSVTWWGGLGSPCRAGESCARLGSEQGWPCRDGLQLALSAAVTWLCAPCQVSPPEPAAPSCSPRPSQGSQ